MININSLKLKTMDKQDNKKVLLIDTDEDMDYLLIAKNLKTNNAIGISHLIKHEKEEYINHIKESFDDVYILNIYKIK